MNNKFNFSQIIKALFQLYNHKKKKINRNPLKTTFQDLLQIQPKQRSKKQIKQIQNYLKQLQSFSDDYNSKLRQVSKDIIEIEKRQNDVIVQLISPFATVLHYQKGSFLEITGQQRDQLRIVLNGNVHIYEPINHKSYKNCLKKVKNGEYLLDVNIKGRSQNLLQSIINQIQNNHEKQLTQNNTSSNNQQNKNQNQKSNDLTPLMTKMILTKHNIHNLNDTPHHLTHVVKKGQLLSPINHPTFMMQKDLYQLTAICASQCLIIEIDYNVTDQICSFLSNDEFKPYIKALLLKFQYLDYNKAKQYVSRQLIIQKKFREDIDGKQQDQMEQQSQKKIRKMKKTQISNCHYQIPYTGTVYFILEGEVTLQIIRHYQSRFTSYQYANSHYRSTPKNILSLSNMDIFGFQQIGNIPQYRLKYIISTKSKLLQINQTILNLHCQIVFNFKKQIESIINKRNNLIKEILQNMQNQINRQLANKIQNHINSQITLLKTQSNQLLTNQISYLGNKSFKQIHQFVFRARQQGKNQKYLKEKQKLSPEIVKKCGLGLQFSRNLISSQRKSIDIQEGFIQLRDSKGLVRSKTNIKINHKNQQKQYNNDKILRRIGVLSFRQVIDHNLKFVSQRKSKFQFQDIQKQKKQFKLLRQKQSTLPKLPQRLAKKQNLLFEFFRGRKL